MGAKARASIGVNRVLRRFGYEIRGRRTLHPPFVPEDFWDLNQRVAPLTKLRWEALYETYQAVRYVANAGVPGAIVECGVWRGGCSILMAETLARAGISNREVYMYDTFAGMPVPSTEDVSISTGETGISKYQRVQGWVAASYEEVQSNVSGSAYPTSRFHLVKGLVEETIPDKAPAQIALLRLDTDLYSSTKHELTHLFPLLSTGGVLLVDDYGAWTGSRQALDTYLAAEGIDLFLMQNPIHGSVVAIKTT
ncbi:MAG: class I SAM-dependent methyltransferase [Armatimonadetes bacterium]|nr:class I SAM-dependent methyltransferase [Armatimonadota bacterium]